MKKICTQCCLEKDEEQDFYREKSGKNGRSAWCKKCCNDRRTHRLRKEREADLFVNGGRRQYSTTFAKQDYLAGIKYCPRCRQKKPISDFGRNKSQTNGIDSHCIVCKRELVKKYQTPEKAHQQYLKSKRSMRNAYLLRKYGITIEQYDDKLKSQNNKCEICGITIEENGKDLAVDHNHLTGQVRGLLCNNCNVAVGFLHDNLDKAKRLVYYVEKYMTGGK